MEATDFQEKYNAKQRYQEMERLYDEISAMGEVIKLLQKQLQGCTITPLFSEQWVPENLLF